VLITVSGTDKGDLGPGELLEVTDFAGISDPRASSEAFFEGRRRPSGETLVHEAIYRKFAQASACFHVHSVPATIISLGDPPTFSRLEMLKGLGHWDIDSPITVPIVPNHADIPALAAAVAAAATQEVPGVLVAGHGSYVWGKDTARCRRHVEILEFLFQIAVSTR
jgi:methylthioribulose-1-phosphate dehydratase